MSLYPNFRGTFANSGGHTKSIRFYLSNCKQFSASVLCNFELDVDSFGSRRGADDGEVVSTIALVLNSLANLPFIPPANFVCGGYTVFTLSVRPSVRLCMRPWVRP